MIRYKVVSKSRGSCVVPPQNHKYYKKYIKGETVKMTPDSFGIAVFDALASAERFTPANSNSEPFQILKVRPIGRRLKAPSFLLFVDSLAAGYRLFSKYGWNKRRVEFGSYPEGTLFYRAVKGLD